MDNLKFGFLQKELGKQLNVAIFTTNRSFDDVYEIIRNDCDKIIVVIPENRINSDKIKLVKKVCDEKQLEILTQPSKDRVQKFNEVLLSKKVNLGIYWSYSQIIQPSTLMLFSEGIWNMHGGKIPEYRGANVLQWAIVNGEKEIGVTWYTMDETIDGGYIIDSDVIKIGDNDNALNVRDKVFDKAIEIFKSIWKRYNNNGIKTKRVDISKGNYYRSRTPIDGLINKTYSKEDIMNLLRAQCWPWSKPIVLLDKLYYVNNLSTLNDSSSKEYICKNGEKIRLNVSEVCDIDLIKKVSDISNVDK